MCVHLWKCDSGEISTESPFDSYSSCLTVIQISIVFVRHKETASSFISTFPFVELCAHSEIKDNKWGKRSGPKQPRWFEEVSPLLIVQSHCYCPKYLLSAASWGAVSCSPSKALESPHAAAAAPSEAGSHHGHRTIKLLHLQGLCCPADWLVRDVPPSISQLEARWPESGCCQPIRTEGAPAVAGPGQGLRRGLQARLALTPAAGWRRWPRPGRVVPLTSCRNYILLSFFFPFTDGAFWNNIGLI